MTQWKNTTKILAITVLLTSVISGVEMKHQNTGWMANAVDEPESYVVTIHSRPSAVSLINAEGNRTIVYNYGIGGDEPYGIAVDSWGNYIVCEPYGSKLTKVTPSGVRTIIHSFASGTFPTGVAIDSSGNYIVAECHVHKLSKITPAGVRTVIYNFISGTGPTNVAIDSSGDYLITESALNILSKVTPTGVRTVIYDFGTRIETDNLWGVALDSSGNYIVTESNANKLSKITPDGVRSIIYNFTAGTNPLGVALDSQGNYIVCERTTNSLSKITNSGERTVILKIPAHLFGQVVVATLPVLRELRVVVKDGSGTPLKGAIISSTAQPSGQVALSGMSGDDGSIVFAGVMRGNYTLQAEKSGYVSATGKVSVTAGGANELAMVLQTQPSSGIHGFPIASVVVGVFLSVAWYWLYARRLRLGGV